MQQNTTSSSSVKGTNHIHIKGARANNLSNIEIFIPKNKLVVLQGLKDYIVVESNDTLLVCRKEDEQKIKQFVTDIKIEKGDKYV